MAENNPPLSSWGRPPAPTITPPPRISIDGLFTDGMGVSPGPTTMVPNFFAEDDLFDDLPSFSEMFGVTSPSTAANVRQDFFQPAAEDGRSGFGEFTFEQNRPAGVMMPQPHVKFIVPPGLSPDSLLDSPGFFPSSLGQFGVSHQQTLAQLTAQFQPQAQAQAQVQVQTHIQSEYTSLSSELASSLSELQHLRPNASFQHDIHPSMPDPNVAKEASLSSYSGQNSQPVNFPVDNPTDDGYIWRKYAQKYLKGSEYRRSYYRCSQPNCPIKKKVERSFEGQITKIIYEGQHNHAPPSKRTKYNLSSEGQPGNFNTANESLSYLSSNKDQEMRQVTPEQVYGSSENEEMGDAETRANGRDEDEPESKRSSIEVPNSEQASFHRIVIEPKIIIQTPSEVDILDDGYKWRKYGQKVVKGNHYPRSYYKCSSPGCNVRKHVERDTSDPKCVLTSYEGKHNHDVPAQLRPAATTPSMQIHSSDQTT